MKIRYFIPLLTILLSFAYTGCPGGDSGPLIVDQIMGMVYLYENQSEEYSISATGDTGIEYLWSIDPVSAGAFTGQETSSIIFQAGEVDEDTPVKIMVIVLSDNSDSEFRYTDITVRDGTGTGLNVSAIHGPAIVEEFETVQYSVTASGDTGITWLWEVDPSTAGTWSNETEATASFTASSVEDTTTATIKVTVDSDNFDPVERTLELTITNNAPGWVQTWGGYYSDAQDIAMGTDGSIVVTGMYTQSIDLDPGPGEDLHLSPNRGCYVSKFTPPGDFNWGVSIDSSGEIFSNRVAVDNDDNIYISGIFYATCDFDPGPGVYEMSPTTLKNAFMMSLNANGEFRWAVRLGDLSNYDIEDISVNGSNEVVTTGEFYDLADFDPSPTNEYILESYGESDIFVSIFNADGSWLWAGRVGSSGSDVGNSVNFDNQDNIYIVGGFTGIVDFDPSPNPLDKALRESNGGADAFLLSLEPNGNYRWAETWGGANGDWSNGVASGPSGEIAVAGTFAGTADFNPDPLVSEEYSSMGNYDAFLSMFNTAGEYQWAKVWGDSEDDYAYNVCFDTNARIAVGGNFIGDNVDFDPGSGTAVRSSNGSLDGYVSLFEPDGNFILVNSFGGLYDELIGGMTFGPGNVLYTVGGFRSTTDFNPGVGVDQREVIGDFGSAFLLKYLPDGTW